jgi:fumarate hydratase subunit alpha
MREAGSNPCPPTIVGVGIGGTFEQAALIAKKALLRPVGRRNEDPELAGMEDDLLERINGLGIGPQGLGGRTTSLAVHVNMLPCHIASLPLAVNIQCHAHRHKETVI